MYNVNSSGSSNNSANEIILEKNFYNINSYNNKEEFLIEEENANLGRSSVNTTSEKPSIIDFVFEARQENKAQIFSIHNNKNFEDDKNNYSNPFGMNSKQKFIVLFIPFSCIIGSNLIFLKLVRIRNLNLIIFVNSKNKRILKHFFFNKAKKIY